MNTAPSELKLHRITQQRLDLTDQVLPLWVQVRLVSQTALHHVGAVVGAGFDRGGATAVRAINQLHQSFHTLGTERDLKKVGKKEGNRGKLNNPKEAKGRFTLIITQKIHTNVS